MLEFLAVPTTHNAALSPSFQRITYFIYFIYFNLFVLDIFVFFIRCASIC